MSSYPCEQLVQRKLLPLVFMASIVTASSVQQAGAESLQELAEHTHYHGVAFNLGDGDAELLIATHHGMFAVMKDGSTAQISPTHDFMGFSPDPANRLRYFASGHPAGGGNSGFLESRDGGVTWSHLSDGLNGPVDFHGIAVSAVDPKVVYGTFGGVQTSRDGGLTWKMSGKSPDGLVQLAASSAEPQKIFAATKRGLKVSDDWGATWSNVVFSGEIVTAIRIEADGTAYAFVLGHGFAGSTEANLTNWELLSHAFGRMIPLHIAVSPRNPEHLIVSTQTSDLLESFDGGKTWKSYGQKN
jgi:photosystem II stability/assembly factor-like uncharacterized protein